MLYLMYIIGYTLRGPTCIKSFLPYFGQCINVLNYIILNTNDETVNKLPL